MVAMRTASLPSCACATTSIPSCASSSAAMPSRNIEWSSASNILIVIVIPSYRRHHARPGAGPRLYSQRSIHRAHALLHDKQSQSARSMVHRGLRVESAAIVRDSQGYDSRAGRERDLHDSSLRVPKNIGQCLLAYPEQCHLRILLEAWNNALRCNDHADAGARRKLLAVSLQRYDESVVVENQGAQRRGDVAHAFHSPFHQRNGIIQPRPDFCPRSRGKLIPDDVQIEIDRREVLAQPIVQFRRQAAPLRLLNLDDALRNRLQFLGMIAQLGLGKLARGDVDDGGTRVMKSAFAIAHRGDAQERVEHRSVRTHQLDLDLRDVARGAERMTPGDKRLDHTPIFVAKARGNEFR